jgi:hypothetical protein
MNHRPESIPLVPGPWSLVPGRGPWIPRADKDPPARPLTA